LKEISVAEGNNAYIAQGGILFTKDMKTLIFYPSAKEGSACEIPAGVTCIKNEAFFCCENLRSLIIPNSVTSIGRDAFHGCENLTNITIPDSVTSIDNRAFIGCYDLTIRAGEGSCAAGHARDKGIKFEAM
jgi:hypothetical protein